MYAAALLPNQESKSIGRAMDELNMDIYAVEHEDEFDKVESMAAENLEKMKEKLSKRRKK